MVRCPYLWKPVTVLLFSNLVRTCSLNYVFSAPSPGVTLVDTVSVTPIYEHPIPFLILELPYAQLLEVHICVWKLLLPHSKSFLNKYTQWIWEKAIGVEMTVLCGGVMNLRRWDFAKFSFSKRKHWNLKIQVLILEHLRLIKKSKTKSVWDKNPKFVALCERLGFVIKKKKTHFIWLTEIPLLLINTGSL